VKRGRQHVKLASLARGGVWAGLALTCLLAACGKPNVAAPPPPEVGVVVLQPRTAAIETELPGRTSAIETADVRPQVNGIILSRPFTEGSTVRRGQVLYQIDPAPYRAAYAQAQAQLVNAQAAQTTAKLKADRYDELVKINAVSRQDDDDARAAAGQAAANVQQAEAAVQVARINLGYTQVVAPISGRVGRSLVTPGALVTASQASALTTIQRLDSVYVDISQSSAQLLALRRSLDSGQAQRGGPQVRLKLEDGSDYPTPGVLQFADVTVDQNTGSVDLRAIVPNPRGLLLPGMYVRAVITQAVRPNAILAPQVGVTRDPRGLPTAYVVDAQNKAQLRTLQTGAAVGDKWLVLDGLRAGDRLIVEGLQKVTPGATVHAVPAGSAPGGAATSGQGQG
jgi:membrane fusion protein (multidrug efflux system)